MHGTGTYIGDLVETGSVGEVYGSSRNKSDPLLIGISMLSFRFQLFIENLLLSPSLSEVNLNTTINSSLFLGNHIQ